MPVIQGEILEGSAVFTDGWPMITTEFSIVTMNLLEEKTMLMA